MQKSGEFINSFYGINGYWTPPPTKIFKKTGTSAVLKIYNSPQSWNFLPHSIFNHHSTGDKKNENVNLIQKFIQHH